MLTLHQAQSQIKSYQRLIWSTLAIGLIFLAISTNRWMTMIGLVLVGLTAFNLLVGLCTWPAQDFKAYKQIVRERKAAGRIGEQLTVLEEQLVRLNLAITRPHDRNVNHDSGPCDYCREITELRERTG